MRTSNEKVVIGLVSEIGGGKGTSATYLKERYGAATIRFSDMLRDVLARLYLPVSREHIQTLSTVLRSAFGEDVMSRVVAEDIRRAPEELVAVDGVRRPDDLRHFKELGAFYLVALETDQRTRYERVKQRAENAGDAAKTWEEFTAQEKEEPEQKIRELMERADFHIDNNGSFEELYRELDSVVKKVGSAKR